MKSGKWIGMRAASVALLCLTPLALGPMSQAQETKEKITVDDVDRTFMLRLPVADKDGIIAVYPIALNGRWNIGVQPEQHRMGMGPGGGGGGGYPGAGGQQPSGREPEDRRPAPADDISFFNQLIDGLTSKFSADTSRI